MAVHSQDGQIILFLTIGIGITITCLAVGLKLEPVASNTTIANKVAASTGDTKMVIRLTLGGEPEPSTSPWELAQIALA